MDSIGHKIINEIIRQNMVRTDEAEPRVLVWSANAAEQLDGLVAHSAEVEIPKMVGDLFAKALAHAGAPMGDNDGDPAALFAWAERARLALANGPVSNAAGETPRQPLT